MAVEEQEASEVLNEEVNEPDAQETAQEVADAEESAAFSASLTGEVRADEAPTEQDDTEEAVDEEVDAQAEQGEVNDVDADVAKQVGVTPEQLTEMLAKLPALENMTNSEIRKVYGKLGEINRAVQDLQGAGSKSSGVKITADKLKRINEEFGEDFAKNLADDLNDVFGGVGAAENAQQNNDAFESRVAEEGNKVRAELSAEMQKNLLLLQHKDAASVVNSDEYKVWVQTLPQEDQQQLNESFDALYIGEKLTQFKDWNAKKNSGAQQRKELLQRAITPKSTQAAAKPQPMTEEEAFYATLNKR